MIRCDMQRSGVTYDATLALFRPVNLAPRHASRSAGA